MVDDFFHVIRSGYVEPWMPESHIQNDLVLAVVGVLRRNSHAGYVTIIDGVIMPGWFLEPLHGHIEIAGLEVATAILRPCGDMHESGVEQVIS